MIGPVLVVIRNVLKRLFADPKLVIPVTYKVYRSSAGGKTTYDDVRAVAIRPSSIKSKGQQQQLPWATSRVDLLFLYSALPPTVSTRDKILVDGELRTVQEIQKYLDLAYGINLQGAA